MAHLIILSLNDKICMDKTPYNQKQCAVTRKYYQRIEYKHYSTLKCLWRMSQHQDQPPPYTPSVETGNNSHIIHQTVIIQTQLKDEPTLYHCPTCKEISLTKIKYVNSKKTHMIAGFIGGCTFWCMLCCLAAIPYLLPTLKKTEHYCANCDSYLGTYSKL